MHVDLAVDGGIIIGPPSCVNHRTSYIETTSMEGQVGHW